MTAAVGRKQLICQTLVLFAVVNIALGTFLIFCRYTSLFWVYIGYCAFYLILFIILVLIFTLSSCFSKDPGESISLILLIGELEVRMLALTLDRKKLAPSMTKPLIPSPEEETEKKSVELSKIGAENVDDNSPCVKEDVKPKKEPSKDSPIRWTSLAIYLVVSTPLIVAMVALVAALN